MSNYDFSTLNSSDLEELVCDLLNAKLKGKIDISYRTFKEGRDRGIDFLYSTKDKKYNHVGQVKHYYGTGYAGLIKVLKKDEVEKVRKLDPEKYIFATSVDLSVKNIEEIKNIFEPYIVELSDIYGIKDLNRLIDEFPQVLNNHYKLWFNSSETLKRILSSNLEFRSNAFVEDELKKRIRLFVEIPAFEEARQLLRENNFLIITGEPGVGKTTLAEMLIYEYIMQDYRLNFVIDDINEAESSLTRDDSKELIYFDDFLGSNSIEIRRSKGSEARLLRLLRRIDSLENKLVIFTTRSFLLNTAIEESENLRRFNLKKQTSIVELSDYSQELKLQLLENHIDDSDLPIKLKSQLRRKRIQDYIITHRNFTPRSIEFITSERFFKDYSKEAFVKMIQENFNKPYEIWKHAYSEQIRDDDRMLLNTLLTFGDTTSINRLRRAFNKRIEFEVKYNNKSRVSHAFENAFRRLDTGFIVVKWHDQVHFINPSLIDFLVDYLKKDNEELDSMTKSALFASQLTSRLFMLYGSIKLKMPQALQSQIISHYSHYIPDDQTEEKIKLILLIYRYIDHDQSYEVIREILERIDYWDSLVDDYSLNRQFKEFLSNEQHNPEFTTIIERVKIEVLTALVCGTYDIDEVVDTLEEFDSRYDIQYETLSNYNITNHLNDVFEDYIEQEIDNLKSYISYPGEEKSVKSDLDDLVEKIENLGFELDVDLEKFNVIDWTDLALSNRFNQQINEED